MSRRALKALLVVSFLFALGGVSLGRALARVTSTPYARPAIETPFPASSAPIPLPPPVVTPVADPGWAHLGRKTGVQMMLADGGDLWQGRVWYQHVRAARQLVGEGGYVVEVVPLEDVTDPLGVERWQFFLDLCADQHLIPILRLATTYDHQHNYWIAPPTDSDGKGYRDVAARYAGFVAALRWPTPVHDVVVGNEPNRGDEWANHPDPAAYDRFLLDVGSALHPVGATVLGPALDSYAPNSRGQPLNGIRYVDAETFIEGMGAADPSVFAVIDVWASHAYPLDPFREDPSKQSFQIDDLDPSAVHRRPPAGLFNRGVNSYDWELWVAAPYLGARAATLPVLITETGWRHTSDESSPGDAAHADVSEELLADYVDLAFNGNHGRYPDLPSTGWTPWNDDPRVLGAVLFALDGDPRSWGHTNYVDIDIWGNLVGVSPAFTKIRAWTSGSR